MTWDEWFEQTADFLEEKWGIASTFSLLAAKLLGYLTYYGLNPVITSGLRTAKQQQELMRRYKAGDPGVVYPPAKNSRHLEGNAIDISTSYCQKAFAIAASLGIQTVAGDRVHFQLKR